MNALFNRRYRGSSVAMSRIDRMYILSDIFVLENVFLTFLFFSHVYMLCVI